MEVKLSHFENCQSLKSWRSTHDDSKGLLLVGISKEDSRLIITSKWQEVQGKVAAKLTVKDGQIYKNVGIFQLFVTEANYELTIKAIKLYLKNNTEVRDVADFKRMYDKISRLFTLSTKSLELLAQGVYGELKCIELLLPIVNEHTLINGWQSSESTTLIDFRFDDIYVEVKTTSKENIRFLNLDQLNPPFEYEDYFTLIVNLVRGSGKESIGELVESIKSQLGPDLIVEFEKKLGIVSHYSISSILEYGFESEALNSFSMRPFKDLILHPSMVLEGITLNTDHLNLIESNQFVSTLKSLVQ